MDETEVSLELSIGGTYGKSVHKERDPLQKFASTSDCKKDLEKKRKVQDTGEDEISEGQKMKKGGKIAEGGEIIYSNSPNTRLNQCSSSRSSAPKHLKDDNSKSKIEVHSNSPSVVAPSVLLTKPPKPQAQGSAVQPMPCVTTTGNGPQGKTVTGFLCKYTKTEVSIVCVCHRRFFSPLEFVKHAGGVDIVNPLRQITIVNPVKR